MILKKTHTHLESLSRKAALLGGLAIIVVALIVTLDVLLRKLFLVTLVGAAELSGYFFAVAVALSYPFVLFDRANVRIDALYTQLPRPVTAVLDVIGMLFVAVFVMVLVDSVIGVFLKSFGADSRAISSLRTPLWIPQFFWMSGLVLFAATAIFLLVQASLMLIRRDWVGVNRVAGIPTLEQTIEEETHIRSDSTPKE